MSLEDELGEDAEAWKEDAERLGVTMASYYNAVHQALEEIYRAPRPNPVIAILEDLAPRFKPRYGRMREWQDDVANQLIRSFRFYRYHAEEDQEMALFLTHRDGIEHVFQRGLWTQPEYQHYRLRAVPPDNGEGRE